MWEQIILQGLTALSMALLTGYLSRATHKAVAAHETGQYRLVMHRFYLLSGILGLIMAAGVVVSAFFIKDRGMPFLCLLLLLFLFSGGLGLFSYYCYKRHYVLYDASFIEVRSPSGVVRTMAWNQVHQASFHAMSGFLTLSSPTGETIKLHSHLVGFPTFVALLEEKTGWSAEQLRLPHPKK